MTIKIDQILSKGLNSNVVRLRELDKQMVKASVFNQQKYNNNAEVREAGLSTMLDGMRRDLTMIKGYEIAAGSIEIRLNKEFTLLKQAQDVIATFQSNTADVAIDSGTMRTHADNALEKLQKILNTQTENGEYLCGGVRTDTPPVKVDLTAVSNIVGELITTNYTDSASNRQTISISDMHKVSYGISADNPAFKQLIGALNFAKQAHAAPTIAEKEAFTEKLNKYLIMSKELFSKLVAQNGDAKTIILQAKEYNEKKSIDISEVNSEFFSNNVEESAIELKNRVQELMLSQKLTFLALKAKESIYSN